MFKKYIDQFMPSDDMKEYLKNKVPSDRMQHEIAELVYYSPYPVKEKLQALKEILPHLEEGYEKTLCTNTISDVEEALQSINQEGVFVMFDCWYDYDEKDTDEFFRTLLGNFDDVQAYIKQDLEEYEIDKTEEDCLIWYRVSKYIKNQNGKYIHFCDYIIFRDEIIYTSLEYEEKSRSYWRMNYVDGMHLNLPVPFEPGDIVEINGFPFGPKFRATIVTIGDNSDCCCVQAIAENDDGNWEQGALKHGSVGPRYYPKLSPLYRAKVCGKMSEKDLREILKQVD